MAPVWEVHAIGLSAPGASRAPSIMRVFSLTLLVLGLVLAAAPALAQDAGKTSFTLTSKQDGGNYVWTAEGLSGNNPTLVVPASQQVTITAKGDATDVPHNIKVGTAAASEMFQGADGQVTYTFTSPASGSVDYVCTIHPTTMKGKVSVAGSGDAETNESPGLALAGVVVALVGAALLVRRR